MANVKFHRRARQYFKRLQPSLQDAIKEKLKKLAEDPENYPGVKKMEGKWAGFYRIRHGNLRIIYLCLEDKDLVLVTHIAPRGDIYKSR